MDTEKRRMSRELLIQQLSTFNDMTLQVALMYAQTYLKYGIDVTEKWTTAVQNQAALYEAERRGYYKAIESMHLDEYGVHVKKPMSFKMEQCPFCKKSFIATDIGDEDPQKVAQAIVEVMDGLSSGKVCLFDESAFEENEEEE